MRSNKRKSPFLAGNRIVVLLTALMLAAGLTATTALAGGEATVAKKKKKKRCPAGTHKVTIKKKKNGRIIKKKKCVPNATPTPVPPTANPANLVISPTSFTYPTKNQNTCNENLDPPDPDCTTQAFTVTNTGGAASGALATSIQELTHPVMGAHDPAFVIFAFPGNPANTCAGVALAPGASCVVSVLFDVPSNAGDGNSSSILHVVGSPGGDATSSLFGHSQ